jgi:hypothetical protein
VDQSTEEGKPRVSINRAGLKAMTVASFVISLALLIGLLAQDGLFTNDPGRPNHPDGLTTLALVLAVLAFLVQLFIFVIQTNAANAAVRRSEDLNSQTNAVLGKIEAESTTTKEVLITQFNRLLDFVVDGSAASPPPAEDQEQSEPQGSDVQPSPTEDPDRPVTASQLQRVIHEALRPRERPTFTAGGASHPSPEDLAIAEYLRAWPSREELERVLPEVKKLPPYGLALLTRYGIVEIKQRLEGKRVGLSPRSPMPVMTQRLLSEGLLRRQGDSGPLALTEKGRELARVLPIGKAPGEVPSWLDELLVESRLV